MKIIELKHSVSESTEIIRSLLEENGFTIFADIDHQKNAQEAGLSMSASKLLIFGNPVAGTQLMLDDITASLRLPLQLAIVEKKEKVLLLHNATTDLRSLHQLESHPVLDKIDALYTAIENEFK